MVAWVFPTGLQVYTEEGQIERFVVEEHKAWAEAIVAAAQGNTPEDQEPPRP